jgi:aspartate carbamoyltransferase catalytic subunit
MRHLIGIGDIDERTLPDLMSRAGLWKAWRSRGALEWSTEPLKGKLLITDFYEPSTRTRLSFEAAMSYLGGRVIGTENAAEFSSSKKGESVADNFRVISGYCDCIVGRFKNDGEAALAAVNSIVPLINGGDGQGEHPTQALIDYFTVTNHFNLGGELACADRTLRVTFLGDNKRSRTVKSLVRLLSKEPKVGYVSFISPPELAVENELLDELEDHGIMTTCRAHLHPNIIHGTDVLYVTRSQNERGDTVDAAEYALTPELADLMPDDAIIMHPLPRNLELPTSIDSNKRARYFEQAHNGLYVRMAILEWLLG